MAKLRKVRQPFGGFSNRAVDSLGSMRAIESNIVDDVVEIACGRLGKDELHLPRLAMLGGPHGYRFGRSVVRHA